ncbi:hypothetical protein BDN72DRAFT_75844 [Pluteus cervinus]|uniref:Uncharacterized protein n=1 Tax=Pluteus cervinus TaxID=181527 RepID=A0ACD3AQJ2_9AGAR|nr:hypothetical protein BDN72DRAFT_75844 [Pluteus cervinus]
MCRGLAVKNSFPMTDSRTPLNVAILATSTVVWVQLVYLGSGPWRNHHVAFLPHPPVNMLSTPRESMPRQNQTWWPSVMKWGTRRELSISPTQDSCAMVWTAW